jgi:hypothetical protein
MYLSGDKYVWDQEFSYEFSTGSIVKSNKIIIDALFDKFVGRHIRFPTREEAIKEAKLFCEASDFPAPIIWAALDGTHVRITCPKRQNILYRNRYVSIATLLTLTTEYRGRWH